MVIYKMFINYAFGNRTTFFGRGDPENQLAILRGFKYSPVALGADSPFHVWLPKKDKHDGADEVGQ